jgi:hypothetical protein
MVPAIDDRAVQTGAGDLPALRLGGQDQGSGDEQHDDLLSWALYRYRTSVPLQ